MGSRKSRPNGRLRERGANDRLLDLRFLEDDVLARDRVVLLELELLGLGARVLLGHVVEAGIGAGYHLDQDRGRLGHGLVLSEAGKLVVSGPLSSGAVLGSVHAETGHL